MGAPLPLCSGLSLRPFPGRVVSGWACVFCLGGIRFLVGAGLLRRASFLFSCVGLFGGALWALPWWCGCGVLWGFGWLQVSPEPGFSCPVWFGFVAGLLLFFWLGGWWWLAAFCSPCSAGSSSCNARSQKKKKMQGPVRGLQRPAAVCRACALRACPWIATSVCARPPAPGRPASARPLAGAPAWLSLGPRCRPGLQAAAASGRAASPSAGPPLRA